MRRSLFNLAAAASAVLCAATVVLWVRSYLTRDYLGRNGSNWDVFGMSGGGQFRIEFLRPVSGRWKQFEGWEHWTDKTDGPLEAGERMPGSVSHFRGLGFWFVTGERWGDNHVALFMPAWFVLANTSMLPSIWLLTRLRKHRRVGGCVHCGYDLRATPDGCPECGTAVDAAAGAER